MKGAGRASDWRELGGLWIKGSVGASEEADRASEEAGRASGNAGRAFLLF